jgi:hypothetical protein
VGVEISVGSKSGECFWIGNTRRSKRLSDPSVVSAPGESGGFGVGSLSGTALFLDEGSPFTWAITGVVFLSTVANTGSGRTRGVTAPTGGGAIGRCDGVCFRLGEGTGATARGSTTVVPETLDAFFEGLTIIVGVGGPSDAGVCLLGILEIASGIKPGDWTREFGADIKPREVRLPKNVGESGLIGTLVGVVAPEDRWDEGMRGIARKLDTMRETGVGDGKGLLGVSNPRTCEVRGKFEVKWLPNFASLLLFSHKTFRQESSKILDILSTTKVYITAFSGLEQWMVGTVQLLCIVGW